jgi:hypothetical protein
MPERHLVATAARAPARGLPAGAVRASEGRDEALSDEGGAAILDSPSLAVESRME